MNHEYFRHAEILLASQIAKPGFAALCCPPPLLGKDGEKDPRTCLGGWGCDDRDILRSEFRKAEECSFALQMFTLSPPQSVICISLVCFP